MTLRSSHRFAVSTCHSSSGVAKAIRASRSPRRVFIARDASPSVSARERTSSTTVFMIPPRNVLAEVAHQSIRRRETVACCQSTDVPVITFASLVVVSHHALSADHVGKPVLEPMRRGRYRPRHAPDDHFDEGIRSEHDAAPQQRTRPHVGEDANRDHCCQIHQHPRRPRGLRAATSPSGSSPTPHAPTVDLSASAFRTRLRKGGRRLGHAQTMRAKPLSPSFSSREMRSAFRLLAALMMRRSKGSRMPVRLAN